MTPHARRIEVGGLAAVLGGVLWVPYGVLEMVEPLGAATVYREDLQYELITDQAVFAAYSLPGSIALLLTSLGLLGVLALLRAAGRAGTAARMFAYVALALAAVSLAGVLAFSDPVFTAGRIFGTLTLGAATVLAGVEAHRAGAGTGWTLALLALGLLGLFLLPLWPLVYAVELLPPAGGAALIALFGLGWAVLGYALWSGARPARPGSVGEEGFEPSRSFEQ